MYNVSSSHLKCLGGKKVHKYVLGVDGGGTKTHCVLSTIDGELVDFLQWGTTNHELLPGGFNELKTNLKNMLETIRMRNGFQWEDTLAVFGLAGVDTVTQEKMVRDILKQAGLPHVHVCNDALLGLYACADNAVGICSLNGTGTGAHGIDKTGKSYHCGGMFELTGDYAGGKILGAEVVRCVYDMLYRGGRKTLLRSLMQRELGADESEVLFEVLLQKITEGKVAVKSFTPLLFEASECGDEVAISILTKSGRACANDIYHVVRNLNFEEDKPIRLILVGSLYTKVSCKVQIDAMKEELRHLCPQYKFHLIPMELPPVIGAVRYGLEQSGKTVDINEMEQQLRLLEHGGSARREG